NRGPEPAALDLLPTLWFRNTWAWGIDERRPRVKAHDPIEGGLVVRVTHPAYDRRWLLCAGAPQLLFTENESNALRLWGVENPTPYVKDGIHDFVVAGRQDAVNPAQTGTKMAARYALRLAPGAEASVRLRLTDRPGPAPFGPDFDATIATRQAEADAFYATV